MLIDYNNKDILNLQEQVLKNTNDINDIAVGQLTLANFGIHVSGILSDSTKLPDVSSYTDDDIGTAYLVGTETPYRLYILTKIASTGLLEWLDIGNFPQPGPKGDKGDKGDVGATGQASLWYLGSTVPTTDPKYTERDCYLNLTNGNVYYYTSGSWSLYGSLRGPRGSIGATGPQGPQGEQGPIGLTGPKGDTGGLVNILGVVATAEELPAVSTVNDTDAYLVGSTNPYDIYVIIHQPNKQWFNIGTTGSTFSIVNLSVPEGTTSGTLSQGDYNTLQESAQNMIYLNGKYYRLNLDKSTSGYQVYSHTGKNPDNTVYIDEFTITISTKAWVITTINVVDSETLNTKLVGYQKKNSITDIDFPHGEAAVTYDTTNGMGITANVQITNQDGSLYTANGDVHVPIFPGDNITIDAKADGTGVVINGPAAVSKEYVDTELAKKAPLVSSTSSTYVTDINGNTTSIPYTPDATAATFCMRDANGNVSVATPTANSHAATKEYVDTHVPEIESLWYKIPNDTSSNISLTNNPDLLNYSNYIRKANGGLYLLKLINSSEQTINAETRISCNNGIFAGKVNLTGNDSNKSGNFSIYNSLFAGQANAPEIEMSNSGYFGTIPNYIGGQKYLRLENSIGVGTDFKGYLVNSAIIGSQHENDGQLGLKAGISNSLIVGYSNTIPESSGSLIVGRFLQYNNQSFRSISDSLIGGSFITLAGCLNGYQNIKDSILFGKELKIITTSGSDVDNLNGVAVFGAYNNSSYKAGTKLIVGAGDEDTKRRDCFTTGYDGIDSYITVGSTKVTESQLIQLLSLLNPSS